MDYGLSLDASFFKGHGHGNDYLVFEEGEDWPVTSNSVQIVCQRTRGVGGDGIVALLSADFGKTSSSGGEEEPLPEVFRLRMFNPDGSEFERSGNGLRVLGAHLFLTGRVGLGQTFEVEVGGDRLKMEILSVDPGAGLHVAVEMGRANFGIGTEEWDRETLTLDSGWEGRAPGPIQVHPVSVGNPHCVVFRPELREEEFLGLGPWLTSHPVFPEGTNVQLARVREEGRVEILIWERGVGRTESSGSSACAVAAACVRRGLLQPGRIRVQMEGGEFSVSVSPEIQVRLEGPVQPLARGKLMPELVGGLTR